MKKESFGFKLRKIYKKISLKEGASIPLLDKKSFDKVSHLFKHAHDNRAFMANKKDHTSYLALASTHFEINEVHSSMESLEANYNITPYNELKLKYHKGSLSQEESKEYELIRDNFTILATRKSDDIDVENANEKAIGVAYLTPKIANILYDYKHIFLIGSEIVEQLFQVDTMDFFDRKDLTPNDMLRYLLNYMEAMNISDLHLFALHDYKYAITGRINTKLISLRPKGLEYVVAEGLINAMRQEGQREPMQQEKEVRALIKAELNNGHSRNFRYHEI